MQQNYFINSTVTVAAKDFFLVGLAKRQMLGGRSSITFFDEPDLKLLCCRQVILDSGAEAFTKGRIEFINHVAFF